MIKYQKNGVQYNFDDINDLILCLYVQSQINDQKKKQDIKNFLITDFTISEEENNFKRSKRKVLLFTHSDKITPESLEELITELNSLARDPVEYKKISDLLKEQDLENKLSTMISSAINAYREYTVNETPTPREIKVRSFLLALFPELQKKYGEANEKAKEKTQSTDTNRQEEAYYQYRRQKEKQEEQEAEEAKAKQATPEAKIKATREAFNNTWKDTSAQAKSPDFSEDPIWREAARKNRFF